MWLTTKHFLPQSLGAAVYVLSDHAARRAGSSHPLYAVWHFRCGRHACSIRSSRWQAIFHRARTSCRTACPGEDTIPPYEWSMLKVMVALMLKYWPTPRVDVFALEKHHKLSAYPSLTSCGSESINAKLGTPLRICFPTLQPHTEGIEEAETATVRLDSIGGVILDQPNVVLPVDKHASGPSTSDLALVQISAELGHGNVFPSSIKLRLTMWPLSVDPSLTENFQQRLLKLHPGAGEN